MNSWCIKIMGKRDLTFAEPQGGLLPVINGVITSVSRDEITPWPSYPFIRPFTGGTTGRGPPCITSQHFVQPYPFFEGYSGSSSPCSGCDIPVFFSVIVLPFCLLRPFVGSTGGSWATTNPGSCWEIQNLKAFLSHLPMKTLRMF